MFALRFRDAASDADRAQAAIDRIRPLLDQNGYMPVQRGIEGEHVTPLDLSARPDTPSHSLFTPEQVGSDLDRLQGEQLEDGGWDFGFLHRSAGQTLDWGGNTTVSNLRCLHEHARVTLPPPA